MGSAAKAITEIDFFTVTTASFRILYVFIVLMHDRRRVVHFNVTEHPTATLICKLNSSGAAILKGKNRG
jgi:hypothetical protein